jgi:hypothetical protein
MRDLPRGKAGGRRETRNNSHLKNNQLGIRMKPSLKGVWLMAEKEKKIGEVAHYFGKIGVAAIKMKDEMKVGDTIHIKGHTTDFEQVVDSMQIEHENVQKAEPGQSIGLKVVERVRETDLVYKKL